MSLKDDKQQNTQIELDFSSALSGEVREAGREGGEPSGATTGTETPAGSTRLTSARSRLGSQASTARPRAAARPASAAAPNGVVTRSTPGPATRLEGARPGAAQTGSARRASTRPVRGRTARRTT